jgi:two-component system cell cycle sensor histidine kinase/response regulator CckA
MKNTLKQGGTILVVDDNEDNRLIAATNLEMAGYTVLTAEAGVPALETLAADPVDLVLLDIMMPGIDGYEVCRRIRADQALRTVKVLMLTAKAGSRDVIDGFEAGADDYVTKPFEIDELLARVRNLVGLKRAEHELRRINADLEGEVERRALALARSEARYRTIVNTVPTSIMLLDAEGRIEAVNAWHADHPLFAMLYRPPLAGALLAENPGAAAFGIAPQVGQLLAGASFEHEAQLDDAVTGGDPAVVRVRGVPVKDQDGAVQGALILHEDLTQERQLQERALEAQKLASIGTLAQGVAHNFNNLLFVVSGNIEILRAALGPSQCQKPFEQARTALGRMAALTRQLATFSRLGEEGNQPVHVGQLLKDVVAAFRPELPGNVRFELEVPDELPPAAGCPGELYKAFHGLVQNAAEALPEGGEVRISVRHEVRPLAEPDASGAHEHPCLICRIADTGVGMDEETQRRAFEPFFTNKQTVGVGLGLSAVHGIVRSHGGTVELESAPGKGTSVTIVLPAWDKSMAASGEPLASGEQAPKRQYVTP